MTVTNDKTEFACEETLKDFHDALYNIDFSRYNPSSPEFMNALSIGMMHMALHCAMKGKHAHETYGAAATAQEHHEHHHHHEHHYHIYDGDDAVPETHSSNADPEEEELVWLRLELNDVKKYHARWERTHEPMWREMFRDELKHAKYLLSITRGHVEDKEEFDELEAEYHSLSNKLSNK